MNLTRITTGVENGTFAVGNRSIEGDESHSSSYEWFDTAKEVILYVVLALGVPGNVLSAIVWLRRHVISENTSAIYLFVLAINDLVHLLSAAARFLLCAMRRPKSIFACKCVRFLLTSSYDFEPLLVLSFSVVRLIAIRRPLQVGYGSITLRS